jgi:NADP-dependent 3-hydroxy acid dehydrogenase YdfG
MTSSPGAPASDLTGQVAIVTGASSGIGEATALALAAEGATVVLGARREDRIEALARRIEESGGKALPIVVDVVEEDQARSFVESTHAALGRIDILVNNAGNMLIGPVSGADTEHWRRMVDVNLLGLLWVTHAAVPIMQEQKSGHIVNLSSLAGRRGQPNMAVYCLTKWGVIGFSEALRQELVADRVRVTVIEPGMVATELQGHNVDPWAKEELEAARVRVGEPLHAADVASAIVYALRAPLRVGISEVLVRPAFSI